MLTRRVPLIRRMRFLRYEASKDMAPAYSVALNRCAHDKTIGLYVRRGMRSYSWIWRTCK